MPMTPKDLEVTAAVLYNEVFKFNGILEEVAKTEVYGILTTLEIPLLIRDLLSAEYALYKALKKERTRPLAGMESSEHPGGTSDPDLLLKSDAAARVAKMSASDLFE